MAAPGPPSPDRPFLHRVNDAAIRVLLLGVLVLSSLAILVPFAVPVVWGIVLAVALMPLHERLSALWRGRRKLAATAIAGTGMAALLAPSLLFLGSLVGGASQLAGRLERGELKVPRPPDSVAGWPLVGEEVSRVWTLAAEDLTQAIATFAPQLDALAESLLAAVAGLGLGVLQFGFSLLLAGIFMALAPNARRTANLLGKRLAGARGEQLVELSVTTIRSVAQGVVGVGLVQALLAGAGMMLAGVPGAGLWTVLVLITAIIQLPPLLVLGPVAAYVFQTSSTTVAVIFLVWALLVSGSDVLLKPLLMGRGLTIPMPVILVGALGGMLSIGILGLFLGAVVLAVGYELLLAWMNEGELPPAAASTEA